MVYKQGCQAWIHTYMFARAFSIFLQVPGPPLNSVSAGRMNKSVYKLHGPLLPKVHGPAVKSCN